MTSFQVLITIAIFCYSLVGLIYFIKNRHQSYNLTPIFYLLGSFVVADLFPLSIFWIGITLFTLIIKDFTLFLLLISVFWLIRSIGETFYWFLQQFVTHDNMKNNLHNFPFYRLVKNDSLWIIYQVITQVITVVSLIVTLYLLKNWLRM